MQVKEIGSVEPEYAVWDTAGSLTAMGAPMQVGGSRTLGRQARTPAR